MKKICLVLLFFTTNAFAVQSLSLLTCQMGPNDFEGFRAKFDPYLFDVNSGFYVVSGASVNYNYSGANLICLGNQPEAVRCIGYWSERDGDIAEVQTSKNSQGNISATFKTSLAYGHHEIIVPCKLTIEKPKARF